MSLITDSFPEPVYSVVEAKPYATGNGPYTFAWTAENYVEPQVATKRSFPTKKEAALAAGEWLGICAENDYMISVWVVDKES